MFAAEGLEPLLAGNTLVFSGVFSSSAGVIHTARLVHGWWWSVACSLRVAAFDLVVW